MTATVVLRRFVGSCRERQRQALHARLQQDVIYWKAVATNLDGTLVGPTVSRGRPHLRDVPELNF